MTCVGAGWQLTQDCSATVTTFLASGCGVGVYEAWYYATRAARRKTRVSLNDGEDLQIVGYLALASLPVTDDRSLRELALSVVADDRRVVTFENLLSSLSASAPQSSR